MAPYSEQWQMLVCFPPHNMHTTCCRLDLLEPVAYAPTPGATMCALLIPQCIMGKPCSPHDRGVYSILLQHGLGAVQ